MAEKEKFAKNLDNNIKKLVKDSYGASLVKIFKIAYETNYKDKVDYKAVHSILNQIKLPPAVSAKKLSPKAGSEAETSRIGRARNKLAVENSAPTPRKRKLDTADEELVQKSDKNDAHHTGRRTRSSARKITPVPDQVPPLSMTPDKPGSSKSAGKPPTPKRRRSDRIANMQQQQQQQQLFKDRSESASTTGAAQQSLKTTGDDKSPAASGDSDGDGERPKKTFKMLRPRHLTRSVTKRLIITAPATPSTVEVDMSPGEKLRTLIPGVRNMKNVRHSLKHALVKKYANISNGAME